MGGGFSEAADADCDDDAIANGVTRAVWMNVLLLLDTDVADAEEDGVSSLLLLSADCSRISVLRGEDDCNAAAGPQAMFDNEAGGANE